jgi:hypothetical protein
LLLEIESVFNMEISRSGLQSLIRTLKGGTAAQESSLPEEDPPSSLANPEVGAAVPAQRAIAGRAW